MVYYGSTKVIKLRKECHNYSAMLLYNTYVVVSPRGKLTYSQLVKFLQKAPNMIAEYLSITTIGNKTLTLSTSHLMFARKNDNSEFHPK